MSLAYIRNRTFSTANRAGFFWSEIYAPQAAEIRATDKNASCLVPDQFIEQCRTEFAKYHIYFEHEYGAGYGSCYGISVSQNPVPVRGAFACEYVIDYGSLTDFFADYFGITGKMLSERALSHKYPKLKKLDAYSLHEFSWYLVRIAREIIFHQCSQDLFEEGRIRRYGLNLAYNYITVEFTIKPDVSFSLRNITAT